MRINNDVVKATMNRCGNKKYKLATAAETMKTRVRALWRQLKIIVKLQ